MKHTLTDAEFRKASDATRKDSVVRLGVSSSVGQMRDGKMPFVCSTSNVDRYNSTIRAEGYNLINFARNPVGLWAHDSEAPPVVRWSNWRVEDAALKMDAQFTPADLYPFGDMIGRMYAAGFLNAVSVGFIPLKYAFAKDRDDADSWLSPVDYIEQELTECSCVPVPGNAETLAEGRALVAPFLRARAAGVNTEPLVGYLEKAIDEKRSLWLPRDKAEQLRAELGGSKTYSIPEPTMTQKTVLVALTMNVDDQVRVLEALKQQTKTLGVAMVAREEPAAEPDGDEKAKQQEQHMAALAGAVRSLGETVMKMGGHTESMGKHCEALSQVCKDLSSLKPDGKPEEKAAPKTPENPPAPQPAEPSAEEKALSERLSKLQAELDAEKMKRTGKVPPKR